MWRLIIVGAFVSAGLSGCQVVQTGPTLDTSSVEQMEQELSETSKSAPVAKPVAPPENVSDALLPPLSVATDSAELDRFDISVEELNAKDFFFSLVKDTPYNIVVHPGVTGNISLELKNVSVDEVMRVVRDVYGYAYEQSGMLYQVLPSGMRTRIFKIDYLNVQRMGMSETQVSAGQVSSAESSRSGSSNDLDDENLSDTGGNRAVVGSRIQTATQADFWSALAETLTLIVGTEGDRKVVVSPQSGIVVVHAFPKELMSVQDFLDKAELSLRRQVILEAKILEVQLNEGFQAGINWAAVAEAGDDKTVTFGQTGADLSPANEIGGVFSAALDLKDFTGLIDLLGSQGTVQVLSSPRISTVNNQKAVIKVGQDEFFVTEVSSQTTTTTTSTTPTVDVELTPFFSGIALDVTPQISETGEIILHIHPTVSEVVDQSKTVEAPTGTLTLPLALSTIRESDSIVKARNGQVVVIGGLMQNSATDDTAKTPFFGDIPLLGHAFRQKRQGSKKSELVILLKPMIADDAAWEAALESSKKGISGLKEAIEPGFFR